jgi:tRNA threonylcarbamoyladenosine biosynthesis protein TsaE
MMQAPPEIDLLLDSEQATAALAAAVAPHLGPGFVLFLSGDLGAGKTSFTRAVLRALGHTGRVRSPTFTLAESYNLAGFELYHFDFYRFSSGEEWRDAGFDEQLGGAAAAIVEWPELGGGRLPPADLRLRLAPADPDAPDDGRRLVALAAGTERGRRCLNAITDSVQQGRIAGASLRAG